jgi:hypothetical protein
METCPTQDLLSPWWEPGMLRLDGFSRRAFLRFCQKGLLGVFALPFLERGLGRQLLVPLAGEDTPGSGRVLENSLQVYDRPSFSGKLVNMYWRDLVVPINGVTIGDRLPEHNRVWYLINNHEGYAHSGKVQPVFIRHNPPLESMPEKGQLAEVTVPYTDALKDPNRPDRFASRLYYSAVFWITKIVEDRQGQKWYQVPDDKYKTEYYASAAHLRPIPPEELAPIAPHVPVEEKRLEVRLRDQVVVAYEAERPVFMARLASGGRFLDGDFSTPAGRYQTDRKRPSRHMASGDLAAPGAFDLPGVPWVSYLTLSGISFHGTYWHNDFGKPRSHGCLNLSAQAARWVYRWTTPAVPLHEHTWSAGEGTRVDVVE